MEKYIIYFVAPMQHESSMIFEGSYHDLKQYLGYLDINDIFVLSVIEARE